MPRSGPGRVGFALWTKSPEPRLTHEETALVVTCLQAHRLGAPLTGMHVVDDACA